jgi:hypothetical protein
MFPYPDETQESEATVTLRNAATAALIATLFTGAAYFVGKWIDDKAKEAARKKRRAAPVIDPDFEAPIDSEPEIAIASAPAFPTVHELVAAAVLGVGVDANVDQIRAAYRKRVRERMAAGAFHPDQGGDVETARRLNDAKNLLTRRARARVA